MIKPSVTVVWATAQFAAVGEKKKGSCCLATASDQPSRSVVNFLMLLKCQIGAPPCCYIENKGLFLYTVSF